MRSHNVGYFCNTQFSVITKLGIMETGFENMNRIEIRIGCSYGF